MRNFSTLFFFLVPFCILAQKYTPIHTDLSGEPLLNALIDDYRPAVVLSYSEGRDKMYGEIDVRDDSVRCVYSGHAVFLPDGVDPSVAVFMDGDKNGINAEHIFPRSKGADSGNPLADLHHLFPCRVEINTNRGSYPFAEINDSSTQSWYLFDDELSSIPLSNIDDYSEGIRGIDGLFEPRESRKGDIARAMFYFYTMYKSQADSADPNFFAEQSATLCQWHEQDPVDEMEYDRTFMIASFQDGKPNPFVLDCSLVQRAYCQSENLDCPELPIVNDVQGTNQYTHSFSPNPVAHSLHITSEGLTQVRIYDIHGRLVIAEQFYNSTDIETQNLLSGLYILQINGRSYKLIK